MRKNAREAVYKLIFEYTFTKKVNEYTKLILLQDANINEEDEQYVNHTVEGIVTHFDELTAKIMQYADKYASPDRLNRADYTALLVGTYELLFEPIIPVGVAISEAISLSSQFGGEKSVGFVNGILSAVNKNR